MHESRNNLEAIYILYVYLNYYLQQFTIITTWKSKDLGNNGIRAGFRLDLSVTWLSYDRSAEEIQNNISCFFERCKNF